jgi:alkylation response protein AidB-like acyl-CoA dehydrogenase
MARLEKLGAFALTEPLHGSDSVALETSARRDGGEWVIDGVKKWIGNDTLADVALVWARDVADGRVKGFLVEKGTPGYDAKRIDGKGSLRAVWQAEITLSGLPVPEENRLPGAHSFKDTGKADYYRRIAGRIYGGAARRDPTRSCTAHPPGSSNGPRCRGISARSTRSPAGPACPGRGRCGSRP